MDNTTVKEEEEGFVIGPNELAVVGCSSQPWSVVSLGIMMIIISRREVLTGVSTPAVVVTVASDGHLICEECLRSTGTLLLISDLVQVLAYQCYLFCDD